MVIFLMSVGVDIKKLFLFLAVIALFTGGITTTVFADDDDDDDDDDKKKSKTLEQHCKKKKGFDKLVCEALFSIQLMLGMVKDDVAQLQTDLETLERNSIVEIMRIDGGRITSISPFEIYFFDGDSLTKDSASDFELASKMVGIDGTIDEVQYKIGKLTGNGNHPVTARIYKNNVEVGSCSLLTSTSSHSSCTMMLNEPVLKSDLLAMTDMTSISERFHVEGKSAFVSITS